MIAGRTWLAGRLSTGWANRERAMLVLRRKVGERIIIGDSIEVTVLRVHGGKVRLGFTAPQSVRVSRQEALRAVPADADAERVDEIAR